MKRLLVVSLFLLSGCVATSLVERNQQAPQLAPTQAAEIEVLYEVPTRPHLVLGYVRADGKITNTQGHFEKGFRKEAAKLGGTAVVVVGQNFGSSAVPTTYGRVATASEHSQLAMVIVWR